MRIAVVCCSLNPTSRSARLAEALHAPLAAAGAEVEHIDLRDHPLPLCDGAAAYADPNVSALAGRLAGCDGFVLALPIYNYTVNAAAKNLTELVGRSFTGKPVGLLCSAGGRASYMSVLGFANGLMLDFRSWIVPRYVYADDDDFDGADGVPEAIRTRIAGLAADTAAAAAAFAATA